LPYLCVTACAKPADQLFGYFERIWTWASDMCATWFGADADRYTGPVHREPGASRRNNFDPATRYRGVVTVAGLLANSRLLTVGAARLPGSADPGPAGQAWSTEIDTCAPERVASSGSMWRRVTTSRRPPPAGTTGGAEGRLEAVAEYMYTQAGTVCNHFGHPSCGHLGRLIGKGLTSQVKLASAAVRGRVHARVASRKG